MFLVDSHCHLDQLDLAKHAGSLAKALAFAKDQDVKHMLCVCTSLDEFPGMLDLIKQDAAISASVGLHPNEEVAKEPSVDDLLRLADNEKVIAIGETGLDYYRSQGDTEWQRERFRNHIQVARKTKKPLIVHTRQAREDTLRILSEENVGDIGGVMHCFTEDWQTAQRALELGLYISFSGIVTFKNALELQNVAVKVPLDRILIETDSPYLAPVPHRGKPNEPAYVRYVAEFLAQLRGESLDEFADATSDNFFKLFSLAKRV